mgnify:CR=1 FL=1
MALVGENSAPQLLELKPSVSEMWPVLGGAGRKATEYSSSGIAFSCECALLCPPLPFKVIKLLFSTSSKTKIGFGTSAQRLSF